MRVKRGFAGRRRHKRLMKLAEGFSGRKKNCYKLAKRTLQKALKHAYKHRRAKKRDFRTLWISRINAGANENGLSYSKLVRGLKLAQIDLDRKVLAEVAYHNPQDFKLLVDQARTALN